MVFSALLRPFWPVFDLFWTLWGPFLRPKSPFSDLLKRSKVLFLKILLVLETLKKVILRDLIFFWLKNSIFWVFFEPKSVTILRVLNFKKGWMPAVLKNHLKLKKTLKKKTSSKKHKFLDPKFQTPVSYSKILQIHRRHFSEFLPKPLKTTSKAKK